MSFVTIILNLILAVGVIIGIVGHLAWSVATQHRDHGVETAGPLGRRRIWSRHSRPHAGPVRPWITHQGGQVWPAE
jgi:hypothetical protein